MAYRYMMQVFCNECSEPQAYMAKTKAGDLVKAIEAAVIGGEFVLAD